MWKLSELQKCGSLFYIDNMKQNEKDIALTILKDLSDNLDIIKRNVEEKDIKNLALNLDMHKLLTTDLNRISDLITTNNNGESNQSVD